jgi:hypothetical protein
MASCESSAAIHSLDSLCLPQPAAAIVACLAPVYRSCCPCDATFAVDFRVKIYYINFSRVCGRKQFVRNDSKCCHIRKLPVAQKTSDGRSSLRKNNAGRRDAVAVTSIRAWPDAARGQATRVLRVERVLRVRVQ